MEDRDLHDEENDLTLGFQLQYCCWWYGRSVSASPGEWLVQPLPVRDRQLHAFCYNDVQPVH